MNNSLDSLFIAKRDVVNILLLVNLNLPAKYDDSENALWFALMGVSVTKGLA